MEPEKTPRERAEDLIRLLVPDWRPTPRQGLWAIRVGIVLGILVAIGYSYDVTLWDWIKLLIVPAAIAGAGLWFTQQQRVRELQIADERAQTDQEIADQRRQDDTLQAYLDGMSQLLTDEKRPLHRAQVGDSLSTVARARTLTVLQRLDGERKARVVQFLHESGLIAKNHPILDLRGANLRGANLGGANLLRADLNGAYLSGAVLSTADLNMTDLRGADLRGANLIETHLSDANLSDANLTGAKEWNERQLRQARSIEGATMPDERTLRGDKSPDGPILEEWLKSKGREEDGQNDGSS